MNGEAPPAYGLIARSLADGQVVPFLGAAASYPGVPEGRPHRLTDGPGLAARLITEWDGYPGLLNDPLTQVAQFYEECVAGRRDVFRYLRQLFFEHQLGQAPPPTADFLADVDPPVDGPFLVMTTNYDCHIERALESAGRSYAVVIQVTTPAVGRSSHPLLVRDPASRDFKGMKSQDLRLNDYRGKTVVYKLHGGFGEGFAKLTSNSATPG